VTEVERPARSKPSTLPALVQLTALFQEIHAEDIRYCHWKSNQHLRASMLGQTDLDVLADRRAAQSLARVLGGSSFKRLVTIPRRSYPGIESYVGLDSDTGALIHLHLHYRLTLGEPDLKGFHLPWEERLLSTRVKDHESGIYVADSRLELLLLIVRAALKVRLRDRILQWVGRPYLRGDFVREWTWLVARVDANRLEQLAGELIGNEAAELLPKMLQKPPAIPELRRFAGLVRPSLSEYRTYGALEARIRRWSREARRRIAARGKRHFGFLWPTRRLLPQGGVVIAFVGADGSGKSTVTAEIARWLSPFIEVVPIYFGTGQGPVSWPRRSLQAVAALVRRRRTRHGPARESVPRGSDSSKVRTMGELLWVWSLTRERRRRATRARRARDRGMIVLCDRFPQSQAAGNDGPCLGHWVNHASWARRTVARRELAAIRCAERLGPDLLVRLNVTPTIALQRKSDTPASLLHRKLGILGELRFPQETVVVDVDASRPLGEVLLEVRRAVWHIL
jgi:thymidylate kinase